MADVEVIITDGMWRKSLSAIRALGKEGYQITVVGDSILTTGFWSKYTSRKVLSPSAKDNVMAFRKKMKQYLLHSISKCKVLIPMEDETLIWLSNERLQLSKYCHFLIPSNEALRIAINKNLTLIFAKSLGLPVPLTFEFDTYDQFKNKIIKLKNLGLIGEYMVKPVSGRSSLGIIYLDTDIEHIDWLKHWNEFGNLLIQERIPPGGEAIGVSFLYDSNSECIAQFVHQRKYEYPISGGPSTSRFGIINDELLNLSKQLLDKLGWVGVAMVEWKINPTTNSPYLMEINPRFWGSLELAVRSGVNFPALYVLAARNIKCKSVNTYQIGKICRWLIPGDILRYLTQKTQRESFVNFLRGLPADAEEWDRTDIKGFLATVFCTLLSIFKLRYWKYLLR